MSRLQTKRFSDYGEMSKFLRSFSKSGIEHTIETISDSEWLLIWIKD